MIYICGKPWTIVTTKEHIFDSDGKTIAGEMDSDTYEIKINGKNPPAARAAALLHELKHVMDFAHSREGHNEDEEECARSTEAGLCSWHGDPRNDKMRHWVEKALRGQRVGRS